MNSDDAKKTADEWVGLGNELSVVLLNGCYTSNGKPGCRGILEKTDSNGLTIKADGVSVYIEYKKIAGIYNKKEIEEAGRGVDHGAMSISIMTRGGGPI